MKKKATKRLAAVAGALLIAAAAVPALPAAEVKAVNADHSFKQEILVVDQSDASHISNIVIPPMQVIYELSPINGSNPDELPSDTATKSRYIESNGDFPDGNVTGAADAIKSKLGAIL